MEPVPDDDRTPIRVPPALGGALAICCIVTLLLGVAAGHRRRARRPRRAGDTRPLGLMPGADSSSFPARAERFGPQRFSVFMDWALYDDDAGFYAGGGGAAGRRGARSSPHPRSARCSAPCSPVPSTGGGATSARPTPSWSSKPAPAPGRWPGRCSPPGRRAARRCATSSSSDRRGSGPATPSTSPSIRRRSRSAPRTTTVPDRNRRRGGRSP